MLKKTLIFLIFFLFSSKMYSVSDTIQYFIVKAKIEGIHLNLIFDNGSQKTILFTDKIFNTQNAFKSNVITASKDTIEATISKNALKVELIDFDIVEKLQLVSVPNNIQFLQERYKIDGVIGNDIISKYDWHFDFKNYKVSLINRKHKKSIKLVDFVDVIINKNQDRDYIEFEFINQSQNVIQKVNMFIDLGKTAAISVNDTLIIPHLKIYRNLSLNTTFAGTTVSISDLSTSNFKLNQYLFNDMILNIYPKSQQRTNAVGLGFFKMFDEVYLLNSEKKLLMSRITNYNFKIKNLTKKDDKIYNMLIPISEFTNMEDFLDNNGLIINSKDMKEMLIEFQVKVRTN